jgi:hypothetical protein
MKARRLLEDSFYEEQAERLGGLSKYPALPRAQQELRATLRKISDSDKVFIERLISACVDTNEFCPTPAELLRRATEMRSLTPKKTLGNLDCEVCQGSGWESFERMVTLGSLEPYMGQFARPCKCRT